MCYILCSCNKWVREKKTLLRKSYGRENTFTLLYGVYRKKSRCKWARAAQTQLFKVIYTWNLLSTYSEWVKNLYLFLKFIFCSRLSAVHFVAHFPVDFSSISFLSCLWEETSWCEATNHCGIGGAYFSPFIFFSVLWMFCIDFPRCTCRSGCWRHQWSLQTRSYTFTFLHRGYISDLLSHPGWLSFCLSM